MKLGEKMKNYPYRQIHLDFHTSGIIENIGSGFCKEDFIKMLQKGNVNSINLFAKCHHGYFYYPTKIGQMHPHLKFDLLSQQIKACDEIGIRVNIYLSAGIDERLAYIHPDWRIRTIEGYSTMGQIAGKGMAKSNPLLNKEAIVAYGDSQSYWQFMCINNPCYKKQIFSEIEEVLTKFKPAGLWLDIYNQSHCACDYCKKEMLDIKMNPVNDKDVYAHGRIVESRFFSKVLDIINSISPDTEVYNNGFSQKMDLVDNEEFSVKSKVISNTVLDIESLPSFLWKYNHYTLYVNYMEKKYPDKPITMMSGRFHRIWGDFGTLKNKEAMEYECFRALAYGSRICLGDQMHPEGRLEDSVYKQIGEVFTEVEKKEPFCTGTKRISEIGVYLSNMVLENVHLSTEGALRVLTELNYQFDFIDYESNLDEYKMVILPDDVPLSHEVIQKIEDYMHKGGKVLISGQTRFPLEKYGIEIIGAAKNEVRYAHIADFNEIPPMDYVMYLRGVDVYADESVKKYIYITEPYFNRTKEHFCSHFQTPPKKEKSELPLLMGKGNLLYLANPLFSDYEKHGAKVHKKIIEGAIKLLHKEKIVLANLPSTAHLTVRRLGEKYIIHILNYIIQNKCSDMEIIEEAFPLHNVKMKIKKKDVKSVRLIPSMSKIEFKYDGEYVSFILKDTKGHEMVEVG
jgi:hypothetical protein